MSADETTFCVPDCSPELSDLDMHLATYLQAAVATLEPDLGSDLDPERRAVTSPLTQVMLYEMCGAMSHVMTDME